MKRGLSFTILALLGLLASVAMATDNNWSGAAFGCIAAGCLFVTAILWPAFRSWRVQQKSSRAFLALRLAINQVAHVINVRGVSAGFFKVNYERVGASVPRPLELNMSNPQALQEVRTKLIVVRSPKVLFGAVRRTGETLKRQEDPLGMGPKTPTELNNNSRTLARS